MTSSNHLNNFNIHQLVEAGNFDLFKVFFLFLYLIIFVQVILMIIFLFLQVFN